MPSSKPVSTRRRGRPKVENPQTDKRATYLTRADGRRLNRYLREKGIGTDADLLRSLALALLDAEGVEDPGEDSELGLPLSTRGRITGPRQSEENRQLALAVA